MAYATKADLAAFTGLLETELPADSDRLLQRASELVDVATMGRIDPSVTEQAEAAKNATCAQVEYWLQVGEEMDIFGLKDGIAIGSFRTDSLPQALAPRARRYLFLAGLLYRGVGMT